MFHPRWAIAIECSSTIGVGAADITKLKANGYYTVAVGISDAPHYRDSVSDTMKSVNAATRKTLLKVKGFSEVKVEKIKEAIAKLQVSCRSCSMTATHADLGLHTSLLHPASSQQLSSATTGREYARFQPEASSWTRFSEGESAKDRCWASSG